MTEESHYNYCAAITQPGSPCTCDIIRAELQRPGKAPRAPSPSPYGRHTRDCDSVVMDGAPCDCPAGGVTVDEAIFAVDPEPGPLEPVPAVRYDDSDLAQEGAKWATGGPVIAPAPGLVGEVTSDFCITREQAAKLGILDNDKLGVSLGYYKTSPALGVDGTINTSDGAKAPEPLYTIQGPGQLVSEKEPQVEVRGFEIVVQATEANPRIAFLERMPITGVPLVSCYPLVRQSKLDEVRRSLRDHQSFTEGVIRAADSLREELKEAKRCLALATEAMDKMRDELYNLREEFAAERKAHYDLRDKFQKTAEERGGFPVSFLAASIIEALRGEGDIIVNADEYISLREYRRRYAYLAHQGMFVEWTDGDIPGQTLCRVLNGGINGLTLYPVCQDKWFDTPHEAIDEAMKVLPPIALAKDPSER